jgi:hypothetical protein
MVIAGGHAGVGVVWSRFPGTARKQMAREVVKLVALEGEKLEGAFTVVQPGRVKIRRTPKR